MECFIGTILPWPMNWAPVGWALCQGQSMPIAQNQALFALLGIQFGGNGTSNFNLPDLRGRVPLGMGTYPTTPPTTYIVGQTGGSATTTLTVNNLPTHSHASSISTAGLTCAASGNFTIQATSTAGNVGKPDTDSYLAQVNKVGATAINTYNNVSTVTKDVQMPGGTVNVSGTVSGTAAVSIGNTGSGTAVSNIQPYMVLNYIIATEGIFPSRP